MKSDLSVMEAIKRLREADGFILLTADKDTDRMIVSNMSEFEVIGRFRSMEHNLITTLNVSTDIIRPRKR